MHTSGWKEAGMNSKAVSCRQVASVLICLLSDNRITFLFFELSLRQAQASH